MDNIRKLQLFRSNNVYTTKDAAIEAVNALTNVKDGELILVRYLEGVIQKSMLCMSHLEGTDAEWTFLEDLTSLRSELEDIMAGLGDLNGISLYKYKSGEIDTLDDNGTVREAYQLQLGGNATKGEAIGDIIKIYKDCEISEIYLGDVDDYYCTEFDSTFPYRAVGTVVKLTYEPTGSGSTSTGRYKLTTAEYEELSSADAQDYKPIEFRYLNVHYIKNNGDHILSHIEVIKNIAKDSLIDMGLGAGSIRTDDINGDNIAPDMRGKHVGIKIEETKGVISKVSLFERDIASDSEVLKTITPGNGIDVSSSIANSNTETVSIMLDDDEDNILALSSDGLLLDRHLDCGNYN